MGRYAGVEEVEGAREGHLTFCRCVGTMGESGGLSWVYSAWKESDEALRRVLLSSELRLAGSLDGAEADGWLASWRSWEEKGVKHVTITA